MEKLFNLLKGMRKKAISALSLVVCVVIVVAGLPITLNTNAAEIPSFVACEDNFDRADSDTVGNGWIEYPEDASSIKDNKAELTTATTTVTNKRLQRPMSEKYINQTVTVKVSGEDMQANKWPTIWLRVQNEDNNNIVGYYFAFDNRNAVFGYNLADGSKKIFSSTAAVYKISAYESMVFTVSATSTAAGTTAFKAEIIGNINSANGGGSNSKVVSGTDSAAVALQSAGTVALSAFETNSSANDLKMTFDDFSYSYADLKFQTAGIDEKFDREDSATIGGGWEVYGENYFAVKSGKLEMTVPNHLWETNTRRIQRPMSEAAATQSASVTMYREDMSLHSTAKVCVAWPVLWLRVKNNNENEVPIGYMCYADGNYMYIAKSTSTGVEVLAQSTYYVLADKIPLYTSFTYDFTVSDDSDGNASLSFKMIGDVTNGADNIKTITAVDGTEELKGDGTMALSGREISSEADNLPVIVDNIKYTSSKDATPLYDLVVKAEGILKSGIGYTKDTLKAIEKKAEEAQKVINKGKEATQSEINEAFAALKAEIDNAVELPEITGIKVNGEELTKVAYNSYNLTVAADVNTLEFEVIPKNADDIVTVKCDSTGATGTTQEFKADFTESYTVTVASPTEAAAMSDFCITVYREGGTFDSVTDDFERTNGVIGNGWIEETDGMLSIIDGNMQIAKNVDTANGAYTNRVIRPYDEATLDQFMVVDIPKEALEKGCAPMFWLRLQEDGDNDPTNNEGYYILVNATHAITLYKRYNNGTGMVDEQLHRIMYMPNLPLYSGTFRFEFTIKGTDTTEIRFRVRNYAEADGFGLSWRTSEIYKDTNNPITTAGTVGISYSGTQNDLPLEYFEYEQYVQPNYMIHVTGKAKNGYFGQWLDLDPNDTYVYSYDIYCANDMAKTSVMPTLQYTAGDSRGADFFYFSKSDRDYKNKTFTGEFKVPSDALKHLDGKVSARVGFYTGGNGADAYIYNIKVYKKGDSSKTNLMINTDFTRGLYGWLTTTSRTFEPITSESMLASTSGDIELIEYEADLFKPDTTENNAHPYESYKGDYMFYSNGILSSPDFAQFVKLIPGETYMFSYYYNFLSNNWIQPDVRHYLGSTGSWSSCIKIVKTTDTANCLITLEFTVPYDTVMNPDGKTTDVRVGINLGASGSQAYFYKPTLYLKSDKNKTNLFYNSDFKRGLEGWCYAGSGTENRVSMPDVFVAPINGEIEVMPVELAYFGLGDLKGDGEWWREFYPNGLPWDTQEESEEPEVEDTNNDDDFTIDFTDTDPQEESTDEPDTDIAIDSTDNNNDTPKKNTDSKVNEESNVDVWVIVGIAATVVILAVAIAVIILVLKRKKNK